MRWSGLYSGNSPAMNAALKSNTLYLSMPVYPHIMSVRKPRRMISYRKWKGNLQEQKPASDCRPFPYTPWGGIPRFCETSARPGLPCLLTCWIIHTCRFFVIRCLDASGVCAAGDIRLIWNCPFSGTERLINAGKSRALATTYVLSRLWHRFTSVVMLMENTLGEH